MALRDWVRSLRSFVNVAIMDLVPQQPHRIGLQRFCKQQRRLWRTHDCAEQLWTRFQQQWRRVVCEFLLFILD
jgi:hypothetical protein